MSDPTLPSLPTSRAAWILLLACNGGASEKVPGDSTPEDSRDSPTVSSDSGPSDSGDSGDSGTDAPGPPNLLVVIVDDVGIDKVGAYIDDLPGYREGATALPVTPSIDRLAAAGLRFSNAWATPVCSPTRASALTGRYPFRTGVGTMVPLGEDLDPGEVTVAEVLGDVGYQTALFGKWHLGETGVAGSEDWRLSDGETSRVVDDGANPLQFGWQHYDGALAGRIDDYYAWTRVVSSAADGVTPDSSTLTLETAYATDVVTDAASAWIAAQDGPWFAWVAYNAPQADGIGDDYEADDLAPDCPLAPAGEDSLARHVALMACVDDRIGRLLAAIPEEDLGNTLIFFLGDNGTEGNVMDPFLVPSPRRAYGKGSVFESGVQVPFVVASGRRLLELAACDTDDDTASDCPSEDPFIATPGRVVSAPVGMVDLAATLSALGGTSLPEAVDAVDIGGCFQSEDPNCSGRTFRYTEVFVRDPVDDALEDASAALREGDDKLVVEHDAEEGCLVYALYDLSGGPIEGEDVAASDPSTVARLQATLSALGPTWMDGVPECGG